MKISFFEEFMDNNIMKKLNLIDFPTKIYLADYHISTFDMYKNKLRRENNQVEEVIWWPIVNKKDGYWLSPFTRKRALASVLYNLRNKDIPILWDAELPKNKMLLLTELKKFRRNKLVIKEFFKQYKGKIYTAEYFLERGLIKKWSSKLMLTFDPKKYNNTIIKMMYTSMHNYPVGFIKNELSSNVKIYGKNFMVGLGVLTYGINGNERPISLEYLERDLRLCKEAGISEVVIYRLGGLDKEYLNVIKKFI